MKSLVQRGDGVKVGVYRIYTPASPDKVYIGSSFCSFSGRFHQHKRELTNQMHGCDKLQKAYNKYGGDNFYFEILEMYSKSDFVSKREMVSFVLSREQFHLDKYLSELKYNIVEMAGTNAGFNHSEEFKKWKSLNMKGRPQHINTHIALLEANTGRKATAEHRSKLSNYWKGRKKSKESTLKRAKKMKGQVFSNRRNILLCNKSYEILKIFSSDTECAEYLQRARSTVRTCATNCGLIKDMILMYDRYPIVNNRIKSKI
jgi:group I intron endonuclease